LINENELGSLLVLIGIENEGFYLRDLNESQFGSERKAERKLLRK
jgi:hypothetical protein